MFKEYPFLNMEPLTCLTLRIFLELAYTCNNVNSVINVFSMMMMMVMMMIMMMLAIGNAYSSSQIITTVIKKSA